MSARNGDKSRNNRLRKAKFRMRELTRELREALKERTAPADSKKKSTKKGA